MERKKENINESRHPRMSLSGISLAGYVNKENTSYNNNTKEGDSRQKPSGMTALFNEHAFTLIELLVVVLIIGILAAVAVPQYKMAVDKTRLANLRTLVSAVQSAEESVYLATGDYTNDWSILPISFGGQISGNTLSGDGWSLTLSTKTTGGGGNLVEAKNTYVPDVKLMGFFMQNTNNNWRGTVACYALQDNTTTNRLCQNLSGKKTPDNGAGGCGDSNCYVYYLP